MNDFKRAVLLFLAVIVLGLIIPLVSAITPPFGGVSYYNFSGVTDLWGSNDANNVGGATSVASYPFFNISGDSSPDSFRFDGTSKVTSAFSVAYPFSISTWINTSDTDASLFGVANNATSTDYIAVWVIGDKYVLVDRSSTLTISNATVTTVTNTWNNVVLVVSGVNNRKLYVNGVLIFTSTVSVSPSGLNTFGSATTPRAGGDPATLLVGYIDEVQIFNRSINSTEISNLYNYGNITSSAISTISNFSVTITNTWNSSTINTFNATINGTTYTTTNGAITTDILDNATSLYNITLTADNYFTRTYNNYNVSSNLVGGLIANNYNDDSTFNVTNGWTGNSINFNLSVSSVNYISGTLDFVLSSTGYFSNTFNDYNYSVSLNTSLNQSDIKFRVYEIITGDELTANITINSTTLGVNESFYLNEGNHTVTVSKTGYYNITENITVTALDNLTHTITGLYNSIINFSSVAAFTGLPITNFSVNTSETGLLSTTNGTIYLPTLQGYNQSYTVLNSVYVTETSSIITNSSWTNLSVMLYDFNSVNINIYDGTTGNLLNQSVMIAVINNVTSFNVNTSTGVYNLSLLEPLAHELRFTSLNYNPQSYFLTVTNDSTQSINVYMTMNTSNSPQLVRLLDVGGTVVSGGVVWLQEQVINSTDLWITIQQAETNFLGETVVYVERDTSVFYRFGVVFDGNFVPISPNNNLFTTKIFFLPGIDGIENPIIIIVNTASIVDDYISNRDDVITRGGISGASNDTVWCSWADPNNAVSGARMIVIGKKLLTNFSFETVHDTSSSSTSGNLSYTFPIINNTIYETNCYLIWSDSEENFFVKVSDFGSYTNGMDKNTGLLYAALIILVCSLLTLSFGAFSSGVFVVLALFVVKGLGLMNIGVVVITTFLAIIIIGFISFKKGGGQ